MIKAYIILACYIIFPILIIEAFKRWTIVQKIGNQSYVKEINLESDKLFFYYNNKAKAEGGGVFVYRVSKDVQRPDKQTQLYNYLAEGVTSAFSGVPNYTLDLHRTLFDSKNKLL